MHFERSHNSPYFLASKPYSTRSEAPAWTGVRWPEVLLDNFGRCESESALPLDLFEDFLKVLLTPALEAFLELGAKEILTPHSLLP